MVCIGLLLVINNKITIQWVRSELTQINSGYYDEKVVNLPITYTKSHLNSCVAHGTRVPVLLTTLGRQLSYTRVGIYNWSGATQSVHVHLISIGI